MSEFTTGQRAACSACGREIEYVGPYWRHIGLQPRDPATPGAAQPLPTKPQAFAPLPWRLAYEAAATVEDANGRAIVECVTPAVALLLVEVVNSACEGRLTNTETAWNKFDAAIRLLEG